MPTANNGNFDVVIEANGAAITTAANTLLPLQIPAAIPFSQSGITAELRPRVRVASTSFPGRPAILFTLDTTGTQINVTQIQLDGSAPVPIPNGLIPLDGTITIQDSLEIRSNSLVVDFAASASGDPVVVPHFNEAHILSSPVVMLYIAFRVLQGSSPAAARAEVMDLINQAAIGGISTILHGTIPVMPSSPPLTVMDFRTTSASVEILCVVGGLPGNRSLITRSILRSNTSGVFVDQAALCVNNASLLRDFIRPALTTRFALARSGFNALHPFWWAGSAPLAIPSIPLVSSTSLTFITAGIDESQGLHIVGSAVASGVAGAFSVSIRFNIRLTITATTNGTRLTITPALSGAPAVSSDVSIAWWVYVAGILAGGIGIVAVLAAIDAFGGLFLNGPIAGAITGAIGSSVPPINVPVSGPGMPRIVSMVSSVSLFQADSLPRMFLIPGMSAMISDGFRQHDMIITMV